MPLNLPPSETFIGEMRSESEPQKMDALSLFLLFCFNFISFSFVPPFFFICFVFVLLNLSLLTCELVFQFFVNGIPLRDCNMLQIYGEWLTELNLEMKQTLLQEVRVQCCEDAQAFFVGCWGTFWSSDIKTLMRILETFSDGLSAYFFPKSTSLIKTNWWLIMFVLP